MKIRALIAIFPILFAALPMAHGAEGEGASRLPADEHFKVETLADGFIDAMELAVTKDGRVFVVERTGGVMLFDPKTGDVSEVGHLPVAIRQEEFARESGLLGIALDPRFEENGWLYLFYSRPEASIQRLARFTFAEGKLGEEKVVLEFPHDRQNAVCHEGGSLAFGPDGCLYLSTGDNTCPFESNGYGPIDERPDRHWYDSQRSAANSNNLRGKVLRIRPTAEGGYEIPEGNLFASGTDKTRPEIFAMGCRNPFRISIDSHSGFLYWGEVGPDAAATTERGSVGFDEINQARKAGYFGWPYFVADNLPYADYDFATETIGAKFDPAHPVNDSPNNTGLKTLPEATKPLWSYPRASACAGPVYHHADYPESAEKLPEVFDGSLIVYDWTSAWIRVIKLDADGQIEWNEPWLGRHLFIHPVDMELGSKGELYVLEYGTPWYDGTDGKLKKITYSETPIAIDVTAADPRMKGLDLEHPGAKLIGKTTCLACHTTQQKSIGPAYKEVAKKYAADPDARDRLAAKILAGGLGAWGPIPMPPHPQHNIEETQQMVDAILGMEVKEKK
ncbi:MAG: PQQ-dependent sugar dehydrogenase [Verrucomicrobiae bacterium]|nr:PQQ-dependent sugar dehydrogenase [Verrucomicrobiae bacterium]